MNFRLDQATRLSWLGSQFLSSNDEDGRPSNHDLLVRVSDGVVATDRLLLASVSVFMRSVLEEVGQAEAVVIAPHMKKADLADLLGALFCNFGGKRGLGKKRRRRKKTPSLARMKRVIDLAVETFRLEGIDFGSSVFESKGTGLETSL